MPKLRRSLLTATLEAASLPGNTSLVSALSGNLAQASGVTSS